MITGFSMRYDTDAITGDIPVKSFALAAVSIAVSILIRKVSGWPASKWEKPKD